MTGSRGTKLHILLRALIGGVISGATRFLLTVLRDRLDLF